MDGTLEQPAHTNDKTLTGRAENVFTFCYVCIFFMLLLFRKVSLKNDCVPQLDKLQSLSTTHDCTYSQI